MKSYVSGFRAGTVASLLLGGAVATRFRRPARDRGGPLRRADTLNFVVRRRGAVEGRTSGDHLRHRAALRAVLQPADPGRSGKSPVRGLRLRSLRRWRAGADQRRQDLYVQGQGRGDVPRRDAHDRPGRQGHLRQDHLPARGRAECPQGVLQDGRVGRGARRHHHRVQPEVPVRRLPAGAGDAVQLGLQQEGSGGARLQLAPGTT